MRKPGGRGSGTSRRGIEVVVVVATAMAKGRPACTRGEVGWVLACHRGVQRACVEGRCPAPLKTKGKKRGNDLSEAFLRCTRHSRGRRWQGGLCVPMMHVRASPAGAWLPAKGDVVAVVAAMRLVW